MGLIDHIKSEWAALSAAPISFVVLVLLGGVAGFGGGVLFKDQQVAAMEALMRLKDGELDAYRKGIEERLGAVEKQLSSAQIETMTEQLRQNPAQVMFWNTIANDGKLGQDIEGVFTKGGWDVSPYLFAKAPPQSSKPFFLSIPDDKSGQSLKAAFDASGLSYDYETVVSGPAAVWINPAPQTD